MSKEFTIWVHPETNAEVVDVMCPKHKSVKGHVAAGQLGTAECGAILKSRKESGPEEIDNGKKVRPTRTIVLESCHEKLVYDGGAQEKARLKATPRPGEHTGAQQVASKVEADTKKDKVSGSKEGQRDKLAGKRGGKAGRRGKKGSREPGTPHPQAASE
jgi:hypothetical protein